MASFEQLRSTPQAPPTPHQHLLSLKKEGEGAHVSVATDPVAADVHVMGLTRQQAPQLPGPMHNSPKAQAAPVREQQQQAQQNTPPVNPESEPQPAADDRAYQNQPTLDRKYTSLTRKEVYSEMEDEPLGFDDDAASNFEMPRDSLGVSFLANPEKVRHGLTEQPPQMRRNRTRAMSVVHSDYSVSSYPSRHTVITKKKKEPEIKPSSGFSTLKEEKLHILLALRRMKADGVQGISDLTVDSDVEEMRMELKAFEQDETIRTGIMTCRSAIVTFAAGLEVANTRFNPFDLDMNGFSESLFEKIERYDGVFERLVRKYSRRALNVSPEMQLMMMFAGNAFTFCFTKSMMKSMQPSMTKIAEENPEMVQKMMEGIMREQMAKGQTPTFVAAAAQAQPDFMNPPMSTRGPIQEAEMSGLRPS